ncbi:MAG: porin family protein [Ignavibacteriaceae bacterium]
MKRCKSELFVLLSFITFFCLSQSVLYSQPVVVGVKGGLSVPDLSGGNTPVSEGYTSRLAPTYGAYINYGLNQDWFLQAEISFAGQGGQRNGMQAFPAPAAFASMLPPGTNNLYANYDNETIINYLEIPILAGYNFKFGNSGFTGYVEAGPYFDFLLNAETKTSGTSGLYFDQAGTMPLGVSQDFGQTTNNTSSVKTFNAGLTGGIGIKYDIGAGQLDLNIRGEYGFITVETDNSNGSNNTGALYLTIGYGFKI